MRVLFSQFDATYFTRVMYTTSKIPNFHPACFYSSLFKIFPYSKIPVILYSSISIFIIPVPVPSFSIKLINQIWPKKY